VAVAAGVFRRHRIDSESSLLTSSYLSVCLFACISAAPTERIGVKFASPWHHSVALCCLELHVGERRYKRNAQLIFQGSSSYANTLHWYAILHCLLC